MNQEKLRKLQAQVRIGGKGTPRRKKKVVHATAATDDKKLQSSLKKLSVNTIPGIEEVNMIKDDGTVIHFNNPKAQASLAANTFAITGHGENKQITEMLPGILSQLGPEGLTQLKRLATSVASSAGGGKAAIEEDDEVPELVENFDEPSKEEVPVSATSEKESAGEGKENTAPVSKENAGKDNAAPANKESAAPAKKESAAPAKKENANAASESKETTPVSKETPAPASKESTDSESKDKTSN